LSFLGEASGVKHTEPAFIEPKQCKAVAALSADDKWTFEIKFDGYRCIAVKRGPGGHGDFVLDGEWSL
jgi:ATP-dependent DNA ligase